MYLLLDWLAATSARVASDYRNRLFAATPKTASEKERSLIRQPPVKVDLSYIAGEPLGKLGTKAAQRLRGPSRGGRSLNYG